MWQYLLQVIRLSYPSPLPLFLKAKTNSSLIRSLKEDSSAIMAEQPGRQPFRFRFPFWTASAPQRLPPLSPPSSRQMVSQPSQPSSQPPSQTIAQQPVSTSQLTSPTPMSKIPSPSRSISTRLRPATADQANTTSSPIDQTNGKNGLQPPLRADPQIPSPSQSISAQSKPAPTNQANSTSSPRDITDNKNGVQAPSKAPSPSQSAVTAGYQPSPSVVTPSSPSSKPASQPQYSPVTKVTASSYSTSKQIQIAGLQQTYEMEGKTLSQSNNELSSVKSNNANQEASRNYPPVVAQAPSPKAQPLLSETSALASLTPPVEGAESKTKQQPKDEKREITKKEVDHDGKHPTEGDKGKQKVERSKESELRDMVPTPTPNSIFRQETVTTQRTQTDILDKQEVMTDRKSGQTDILEEGVKNIVSTIQTSILHNTTKRESRKNASTYGTNLQKTVGTPRVSQQMLEDSSLQPRVEPSLSVVTLAGENQGAMMNIGSDSVNKERLVSIHRGYKLNKDHKEDAKTNEQESTRQSNKRKSEAIEVIGTYINNNMQSINNSILHNSSCSERNPGVHIMLSDRYLAQVDNLKERKQINDPRTQQLNSETRIRRRCLRSLFMESDSDPENPQKPLRHGCRHNCKENGKGRDKNADISTRPKDDGQSNAKKSS